VQLNPALLRTNRKNTLLCASPFKRPEIKHGMRKAFYSPREDIVAMPDQARFDTEADYYGTLYHELTHATGHASRV
jgi:antirestriction protein ArdC